MRQLKRKELIAGTAAAAVLAAGVTVALVVYGSGGQGLRPPRAVSTVDRQPRVCLLTGARADAATADRAWQGVRRAAADLNTVTIQRYALPSGVAPAAYLGALTQLRCTVIVTVGDDVNPPTAPVASDVHYITVSRSTAPGSRITRLSLSMASESTVAHAVAEVVTDYR